MDAKRLARHIQYTNFAAGLTEATVRKHCEDCLAHGFDAAMLPPVWVPLARDILAGSSTHVATAFSFPLGCDTTDMKVGLARVVVDMGVTDFDFVGSTGLLLSGRLDEFAEDIRRVVEAAPGCATKVVVEFGLIADAGLRRTALRLAEDAGVTYVKQSSGAGAGIPATAQDIGFMKNALLGRARIKASGGIKTREGALELLEAGAELMGTSAAVIIVTGRLATATGY